MTRLLALAVALVLAAALAGCGSSNGDVVAGEPISLEQLSQAAQASAEAKTGRFAFGFSVSAPELGQELGFSGEGAFDTAAERSSFSADMGSFMGLLAGMFAGLGGEDAPDLGDPALWKIETIRDGSTTYVRFPVIDDKLPAGKTWVRLEDGEALEAAGFELREFEQFTQPDPKELLELLRLLAGELETVGTEIVRGAETTHYRIVIDADSIAESAPAENTSAVKALGGQLMEQSGITEVPLDIWVDADGLIRKLALDVSATEPGKSTPSSASVGFELWDLGKPVGIELPPASQVASASELED